MINWLQKWYADQCNGDWEDTYGINIQTSDNPGWIIDIDLALTPLENLEIPYTLCDTSENDWYGFSIRGKTFHGAGDANKLEKIIEVFCEITRNHNAQV